MPTYPLSNNGITHRLASAMNAVFTEQHVHKDHPETEEFIKVSSFHFIGEHSKDIRYYTAERIADLVGYTGADYDYAVTRIFEFFEDRERLLFHEQRRIVDLAEHFDQHRP